jgi:hypothetical protein
MPESASAGMGTGMSGTRAGAWWDGPKQLGLPVVAEIAPAPGTLPSLVVARAGVPEHRHPRGFKAHQPPYPLVPMLLPLLVGVLCGRRG